MGEGSLHSFSRSPCIGSQRVVSEPLPGFQAQNLIFAWSRHDTVALAFYPQFVLHKYQIKFSGNRQDLTEKGVEDIYKHYGEDNNMSFDEFKQEVTRCRHWWLLVENGIPQTLVETLDFTNPKLCPGIYVAVKTRLTYLVSTWLVERSFSSIGSKRHFGALCPMRGCPSYQ